MSREELAAVTASTVMLATVAMAAGLVALVATDPMRVAAAMATVLGWLS